VPSWAVTATVIVFDPTFKGTLNADPEVAAVPFTVSVAPVKVRVGVTLIEVIPLATEAV